MGRVKIGQFEGFYGLKNWFRSLINLPIIAKDEKTGKSTRKPAIVGDCENSALVGIKGSFETLGARQVEVIGRLIEQK